MSVPAVGVTASPIVFTTSQLERRILTAALGLLPVAIVIVERIDQPGSSAASPLTVVAAAICFVLAMLLAASYRYELRIDPRTQRYELRAGFPVFSRPARGDLADVERVLISPDERGRGAKTHYTATLDWRSLNRASFCLASSLDEASAERLSHQLTELSLPVVWTR